MKSALSSFKTQRESLNTSPSRSRDRMQRIDVTIVHDS